MNRALLIMFCLLSPLAGAAADPGPRCGGEAASPGHLQLQVGKSSMLRLPEAVQQRSVGNPAVVQAMLVAPDTLYVVGVDVGSTNMIIQGRSGVCSVVNVSVSMDPAGLQTTLAALMPEERAIRVTAVADTLVLSGTVQDAGAVLRAVELAHAYVRRATVALALPKPADGAAMPPAATAPAGGAGGANSRIINMLDVSAPQQVMLAVQIAEVSKSLLERLEVGATLRLASGSWATTLLSNFLSGTANGLLDVRKSNGRQQLTIEAQKQDGLVRILAEPTVMAISGQEGSFLAGGKIFIPVGQDNNKITLEEREYGVGLRFTPTVLSGGRINLKVAPEVSELSREGVGISAAGVSGRSILPVITTRRASTTVQLYDGQSYAIGGLIKNNQVSNITGVPWLSEVPILGALFRSTDFQHDRTELLFVITAHLVKPLPADAVLPTAQLAPPSRMDLMLGGKMEGAPPSVPPPRAANGFELK
ncbi:type II and III secretion system protein family protein [Janthinobacterium sp. SUN033]|uniref:type II and III secretion system protein family protein n=1 Tax=Janthinobacterium sp. SUN033 TaxID=3002439 RepID=UPI0025AFB71E|nr:type II and III secretion system protein family protein [Janthinobacterium sp. SUN033]MDN2678993.1 type II and III secretion system protein family protein [Janthinobacterium sp. SUN033]